jgi:hypothetical protein
MTTIGGIRAGANSAVGVRQKRPATSLRYDYVTAVLLLWLIGGTFLDAWAHNHIGNDLDTFFTPWHGVMYSGFLAVMALTVGTWFVNTRRGYDWRHTMPAGYELSLIGIGLFGIGGVGDMIWHTLFGIEVNIQAAFSPTHQLLIIAEVLLGLGPLRSAMRKVDAPNSLKAFIPIALSMAVSLGAVFLEYQGMNLIVQAYPSVARMPATFREDQLYQVVGVASGILMSISLMGLIFLTIRRWSANLPFGLFTFVFTVLGFAMATQRDTYVLALAMLLGGLTADLGVLWLQPSEERRGQVRALAVAVPMVLFSSYMLLLAFTSEIWWSIHTVGGLVVSSTLASLVLSYLVFLPSAKSE